MKASPFHPGELQAQARAGERSSGGGIRDFMSEEHRAFFEALPFVVLGGSEGGWPVATILAGEPGFVSAPNPRTLRIAATPAVDDPAARALVTGAPAGALGIELATRRRNRANGILAGVQAGALVLAIEQSFGNCPQYIHVRELQPAARRPARAESFSRLDAEAQAAIASADTFFVATAAHSGVDVSHRGGPAGFVHVDGATLTIPDYRGNRYFNTLGNLVANPRAALLFVDFERGDLLHVQGTTETLWDKPGRGEFAGAERLWRVHVEAAVRRRAAIPLQSAHH